MRSDLARNRTFWNRSSDWYDRRFRRVLRGDRAAAWGIWRIPERSVRWLGEVRGRSVLEVGCGAARWSVALARRGARVSGLDQSAAQLRHARTVVRRSGRSVPLVLGSATALPFRDRRFDLVFCDWGALEFADPRLAIPECARVLRPGGRLVFAIAHPFRWLAWDRRRDRQSRRLHRSYFGQHRLDFGDTVEYQLTFADWIDLFTAHGLAVEGFAEPRPPPGRGSRYLTASANAWARRWPFEAVWRLRRTGWRRSDRSSRRTGTRIAADS
jgi:ubiquinone/menaquinone biosynthesis C-methylase UbiE